MEKNQFYRRTLLDDSLARQAGFNPYYPKLCSGLDDPVMIGDHEFIDLASNNYLGLANDERIKVAAKLGIEQYGVSLCATPIATGYSELLHQAEKDLSAFLGLDDSLVFPSCYQANNGLFQAITKPEDLILVDRFAHSSLYEGIRNAHCPFRIFRHNDMEHLENLLKRKKCEGEVFVVTESVFSTEGSVAPFNTINELCMEYGAIPIVDDSHGIGVIGNSGKGILSQSRISDYQGIYTTSLGKAVAVNGGMIAGKRSLIHFLRYKCSHLIYSTAIAPSSLMALRKSLKIIQSEFKHRIGTLWDYTDWIWDSLTREGFILTSSETPINSIKSGNSLSTVMLAKWFYNHGILTTPFIHPSVPVNEGRLRIIASANMKESSIEYALEQIKAFNRVMA